MGLTPDYETVTYLTSRKTTYQYQTAAQVANGAGMYIAVQPDYDITFIETEESSLGLLGGAWSIAIVAYKLLFGDDVMQPFGVVQKHGHFHELNQKKLTEHLSTIPLAQVSSNNDDNYDNENQVVQLEKEIGDLELFLRDYVVEAQQLDNVYKNIETYKNK
ncbi:731_t:CDS:2 [Dentiscutata erythropus]|uniref:731_t:CDS:1 n=1 Tax=Dentiscutata erythropus TaxID=1348616 RepID=A0A9N9IAP0_9GLOM|nr:731_t:CDS:2 [Dentiscutata erythropus]